MTTKAERDETIHERWRARMENDPAVIAGVFTAKLHPFRVALTRT